MKIPYDATPKLQIDSDLLQRCGIKRTVKNNLSVSRFETILKENLRMVQDRSGLSPLTERILEQMIQIVRGQMKDYFLRSLLHNFGGPVIPGLGAQGQQRSFDGVAASKNQHTAYGKEDTSGIKDINIIADSASEKYGVDAGLIKAVIKAESDYDASSTSSKGAMGLMQLMPETAEDLGVVNPYSPVENVIAGTRYLKKLLDRYGGDTKLALAAYNWGMGNVERNPGKLPEETKTYITRVQNYYRKMPS